MTEIGWTSPFTLQKYRERSNLKPEEVAQQSQELSRKYYSPFTKQQIQEWEQGVSSPDLEHLETLSEIYHVPVGHFFLSELPEVYLPLSFRGLAFGKENSLSPLTRGTINRFLERSEWIVTLIEEYSISWEVMFEPVANFDVATLVRREKKRFNISEDTNQDWISPDECYAWWRSKVESQGIFCFEMKLEPGEVRGASRWIGSRYPFILINHQDAEAATGRLFTLLHEYAHLLTEHESITCDFRGRESGRTPEKFANRFAAHMLVSPDRLKEKIQKAGSFQFQTTWSDSELDSLRKPFFVSRDVIAIMLQEMELAPRDYYQKKREAWERRKPWGRAKTKNRPTKNEQKAREMGKSALHILLNLEKRQQLPVLDTAYALDMKIEKTIKFLEWASGTYLTE